MGSLAILGGEATIRDKRSHYQWPPLSDAVREAVAIQLDDSISIYDRSGIIDRVESAFERYYNRDHALLTNAGTSALHSAFVGAQLGPGDEVIVPAYTFFASATPLFFTGATPILVDIRPDGNVDPTEVKRHITANTKAIVVTHMWGMPCDMEAITRIATDRDLILIEDASHAHGARIGNQPVGTFGTVAAFSLQAQKTVTGGEGGVLLTDEDEVFYRALMLGHYNKRCKTEIPSSHPLARFATTGMGLKLRIHPLAAAIAAVGLRQLDEVIANRNRMAAKMTRVLSDLPGIHVAAVPANVTPTWYAFVMQYEPAELDGLPIDVFYRALLAEGCAELDRPGSTCPLAQHPLFQDPGALFPLYAAGPKYQPDDFPVAERFHSRTLKLPVWHDPSDEPLADLYLSAFSKVVERHAELL